MTTKFFRLQPEYTGQRWSPCVTYLSGFGGVKNVTQVKSVCGTAYGDYSYIMFDYGRVSGHTPYNQIQRSNNDGGSRGQETIVLGVQASW